MILKWIQKVCTFPEGFLLAVFTQWLQIFGGDTKVVVRAHLVLLEWIQTGFPCRFSSLPPPHIPGNTFSHFDKYIFQFGKTHLLFITLDKYILQFCSVGQPSLVWSYSVWHTQRSHFLDRGWKSIPINAPEAYDYEHKDCSIFCFASCTLAASAPQRAFPRGFVQKQV